MYTNPYLMYGSQPTLDRINTQINELEKMKEQMQKQTPPQQPITQNFQIAPTNRELIRYAGSMDEVQRDMVFGETPYFSKDMSVVWIKNPKGEIKTYELTEIIPRDEKDLQIETLKARIEALENKEAKNESNNEYVDEPVKNEKPASVSSVRRTTKK